MPHPPAMCAVGLLLVASVAAMPHGRRATDSALDVGEIASEIASLATEARFAMLEGKGQWKKTINKFKRAKRNGRRGGEVSAFERKASCGWSARMRLLKGEGTEEDARLCATPERYVKRGGSRGCTETGELFDDPPTCEKMTCSDFNGSDNDCPSGEWEPHYACQECTFENTWGSEKKCRDRSSSCTRDEVGASVSATSACGWGDKARLLKGEGTEEDVRLCATPKYKLVSGGYYECNGENLVQPESPSTCKEMMCSDFTSSDCPFGEWEPHHHCQVCTFQNTWGSERKCRDRGATCTRD